MLSKQTKLFSKQLPLLSISKNFKAGTYEKLSVEISPGQLKFFSNVIGPYELCHLQLQINCVLVTDIFPYLMLFAFLAFINFSYIRLFVIISSVLIGCNVNFTFALMTLD